MEPVEETPQIKEGETRTILYKRGDERINEQSFSS